MFNFLQLGKIYRGKSNSTTVYLKEVLIVEQFSSRTWRVSDVISKILTSSSGLVVMKIEVYPNGFLQSDENYVSVFATLLSDNKHCYFSTLKIGALTSNKTLKNQCFMMCHWQNKVKKCGFPRFKSRKLRQDNNTSLLQAEELNIQVELFCMLSFEQATGRSSVVPSAVNSIEMTYLWTICDLSNFPDSPNVKIASPLFPISRNKTVKFSLQMVPRGKIGSNSTGHMSLYSCVMGNYTTGPAILMNHKFFVRNYGQYSRTIKYGPFIHFYDKKFLCYGTATALSPIYRQVTSKQCLIIEYHGAYNITQF